MGDTWVKRFAQGFPAPPWQDDTRLPAEPSPMTSSSQSPLAMSVQFLPLTEHCPQSFPSVLSVPLFGSYDFWETLSLLSGYSLLYNNYLQI